MRKTSSTLIVIVVALLSLGIVMLASTSSVRGSATFHDAHYFLKRQLVWLAVAVVAGWCVLRVDYHVWQRWVLPLVLTAIVLLAIVLVPGIGTKIGGSRRWLRLGPLSVQPSEFAKFAAVVGMSAWMAVTGRHASRFMHGLLYPIGGLGLVCGLLILEPDFGTTILVGTAGMFIMFAGGARIPYLVVSGVLGLCGFALAVLQNPNRMGRILAFLMPEKYPEVAYHLAQSKVAFIKGGLFGVGLGSSVQKQFYLPEAHTDFILAIIGEELGFIATIAVVLLFAGLFVCGMMVAFRAPDRFGRLMAFGFTLIIVLQGAINIGVVTGCLPTKGLPLPFISYGGTSLVASVAGVCVLLNIASQSSAPARAERNKPIKDRGHRF